MARPKSWVSRVLDILAHLEGDIDCRYTRAEVERIFGVSASQAKHIMTVNGAKAPSPGVEKSVPRAALLAFVKYGPEARAVEREQERRRKLAERLKGAEDELGLRRLAIPTVQRGDYEWAMLRDLPRVKVTSPTSSTQGQLTISFRGELDLLDQLYKLALAIRNDEARFTRAVEDFRASGASGGGNMAGPPKGFSEAELRAFVAEALVRVESGGEDMAEAPNERKAG